MSSDDKIFRVSSEVRSVLQRKHNSWLPVRVFDRVQKDLGIFHRLCKVFFNLFQENW